MVILPSILEFFFYNELAAVKYLHSDVLLVSQKLGIVLFITGIISFISRNATEIPDAVIKNENLQIYPLSARKRNPMVETIRELKSKFGNEIPIRH